jgi:hypothetical protein
MSLDSDLYLNMSVIMSVHLAAINQIRKKFACQWVGDGTWVNCVCPWFTETPVMDWVR